MQPSPALLHRIEGEISVFSFSSPVPARGVFEQDEGTQFLPAWRGARLGLQEGTSLCTASREPLPPSSNRRISRGIFEASPAELGGAEQNAVTLRALPRSGPQKDITVTSS